jgi:hypothetical protein
LFVLLLLYIYSRFLLVILFVSFLK